MNRPLRRTAVALAAGGLVLGMLAAPSSASPRWAAAPPGGADVVVHPAADTRAEARAVAARWTPEAMRRAIPLDQILANRVGTRRAPHAVPLGAPQTEQPTAPAASAAPIAPQSFPNGGGAWTGGGEVAHTAGRVFFLFGGRRASCSGDAVTSENRSVVITAGHCVKLEGEWHTDWVFVPAYNDGDAPFGTWTASELLATPQWVESEDLNYDVGAAVVDQLEGQYLTDVVGGQGIAFNQETLFQPMYAFGWPAAAPYDGTRMIYCSGNALPALLTDGIGMVCDMTGGSSGGPWFLQFDEATGLGIQSSVNSYKINIITFLIFGPTFGADAQNLYNEAQAT